MKQKSFYRSLRVIEIPVLALLLAIIISCSSEDKGNNKNNTVNLANVPACSESDLVPFQPVGTGIRVSQLPQGQYNYTGGHVYIESVGITPLVSMHVIDTNPNSNNYSGNLVCVTNLAIPHPAFETSSFIYRFANITGGNYNLAITRALRIFSDGSQLQTQFSSDDLTRTYTAAEVVDEENRRYARGEQIDVYQTGANTYRVVIIRTSTAGTFTGKIHIAADYTKIQ